MKFYLLVGLVTLLINAVVLAKLLTDRQPEERPAPNCYCVCLGSAGHTADRRKEDKPWVIQ